MPVSGRQVIATAIILFAIGFLTLTAIVGMNVWLGERARLYTENAIDIRNIRTAAVELRSSLQTAESSQRGYLILGNEIYLAPFDNAKLAATRELSRLMSFMASDKDREEMLRRLSSAVTEKLDEMDKTVALKRNRQDDDVTALFRSNRGKTLMDEINVFLSSIIRGTDADLASGMAEQKSNTEMLRLTSIFGGAIILLVVGIVTVVAMRYAKETIVARDQVQNLNISLERRVAERTSALGKALARAEMLLDEVNHRVANSLTLVASLVRLQARAADSQSAKAALGETETRIYAIADVHKRLYNSGDVGFVALNEYLADLLTRLESSMHSDGHGATLKFNLDPIRLAPDASVNLGIVVNELVTNAFKYAYPDSRGEVRVSLRQIETGRGELIVEDDGIGISPDSPAKGTGLGARLVSAMAANVGGEISYQAKARGTSARIAFPIVQEA